MHAVSNFLSKYSRWHFILLLFILILIINLFLFPICYKTSPENMSLDSRFSYSVEKAYNLLDQYAEKERASYFTGILAIDLIYPFIYCLFFCVIIFKLTGNTSAALLAFVIMPADYLENTGILIILDFYPQQIPFVVKTASLFTSLKWILLAAAVIFVLVSASVKVYKKYIKKT